MSAPNKSLDKSKRFAGVKANDFVNKARPNDANRSAVRPQGWANLGKINSRRIPPPANLPSLKSETGVQPAVYDPTVSASHGWSSNESPSSSNTQLNPTQQQIDSLPMSSSTPVTPAPSSADIDKSRGMPSWSNITAGTNANEPIPNLLALNDFPRLATTPDRKPPAAESTSTPPVNASFRPANLATWKEGGGSRIQPLLSDLTSMPLPNAGANPMQQSNIRMYPPSQMWTYQSYPAAPGSMHPQRLHAMSDYKSPTILRDKDIDDLSKLTDTTWANASPEVNYEEKIRFSDDEDETIRSNRPFESNPKAHRSHPQRMPHARFLRDDEHLKQMQEDKNSELINALAIAKQRRDEQERHLRSKTYDDSLTATNEDHQPIPGYQTRPLMTANDQDNYNPSLWQSNREMPASARTRHDTANSQTFSMKSWSDQMDSFNYTSLHEKSGAHAENNETSAPVDYNQTHSPHNSPSPLDSDRRVLKAKKVKPRLAQPTGSSKQFNPSDTTDYQEDFRSNNNQEQWAPWNDSSDNGYPSYANDQQQQRRPLMYSEKQSTKKSIVANEQLNQRNKQPVTKMRTQDRQPTNSRPKVNSSTSQSHSSPDAKSTTNKNQLPWRPLSPNRLMESPEPTPQESPAYKSKQRYPPANSAILDTASIPPLMSVRSDPATTANLYKAATHTGAGHYSQRHEFYNEGNQDDTGYYEANVQTHQRYPHVNLQNRGYTALGSYGRYRRGGVQRQQPQAQYPSYHSPGSSSMPTTSSGMRQKKNGTHRKSNESSDQAKTSVNDEVITPLMKKQMFIDETPIVKPIEPPFSSPALEKKNSPDSSWQDHPHEKSDNPLNAPAGDLAEPRENDSMKANKKTSNVKRRTQKDQQHYYQTQQAPRHRNNYAHTMQDYESSAHQYYGNNRQALHPSRNTPMHDASAGYYYENHQQHYSNQYHYSNEHYPASHSTRLNVKKTSKRGGSSNATYQHDKTRLNNGNGHNNNNNNSTNHTVRHHSTSDNDQKEGEEWETASESSTNMRNGHHENNGSSHTPATNPKSIHSARAQPKKNFHSQRPNARQIFKYTNA